MFHCCAYCSINTSVGNTDEISLHGQNPTAHCVLNPNNDFGIVKHNAVLSKLMASEEGFIILVSKLQ